MSSGVADAGVEELLLSLSFSSSSSSSSLLARFSFILLCKKEIPRDDASFIYYSTNFSKRADVSGSPDLSLFLGGADLRAVVDLAGEVEQLAADGGADEVAHEGLGGRNSIDI